MDTKQMCKNIYVVTIDLSEEKLLCNKSTLPKLKSRLQNLESFTVLISWVPPVEAVCPSSVAKYFANLGYAVKECIPTFSTAFVNCEIPQIDLGSVDKNDAAEFVEWLGMVSVGGGLKEDPTGYLSSYVAPSSDGEVERRTKCLRWRGFFTVSDVNGVIEEIMKKIHLSEQTWVSIYVQGFSDCPVTWGNEEQHYFTNGDNGYVIIFNKDRGLICTQRCSRKRYK
ncbi:hypothetical protein JTB14_029242 [Gonioctena quinquepunctata]|nr:hypothetical protein JTB14_029242 [Gonioctena quinquepunctata]